jgi:glucose dehydrogenase
MKRIGILAVYVASFIAPLFGQVTPDRLLKAEQEPENWLTYSGGYQSHRYSALDEINRNNARKLKLKWVYPMSTLQKVETTPLVVDGVMYVTQPPNDVIALDPENWTAILVAYPQPARQDRHLLRPGKSGAGNTWQPLVYGYG